MGHVWAAGTQAALLVIEPTLPDSRPQPVTEKGHALAGGRTTQLVLAGQRGK